MKPIITPFELSTSHRTGTLKPITSDEIAELLGLDPEYMGDEKVENQWQFKVELDGEVSECSIWDYRGSHHFNQFSTFGPDKAFKAIFGDKYSHFNF